MGGMGAKSNFQFGRNLGLVEAITHLQPWADKIEYVQPKVWQKGCGIVFQYPNEMSTPHRAALRKRTVAKHALELYPKAEIYGPRGGLKDGRSDALMIAHYLRLKYEGVQNGTKT